MPQDQDDVDALLAEVSALADEAVTDIAGQQQGDAPGAASENIGGGPASDMGHAAFAPTGPSDTPSPDRPRRLQPPPAWLRDTPERLLQIEVPVIVRLAERTMPLSNIVGLTTGAIIEFDKSSDSLLDLMINNKCIGHGQAVKVGENFGLRVTDIGSVRDRITALGDR